MKIFNFICKIKNAMMKPLPKPYPELVQLVKLYNSKSSPPPEVLYIGDSVVERIAHDDEDKMTLGKKVIDVLKPKTAAYIAHSAYHMKIFYWMIKCIEKMAHRPKIIIIPINMRSFSPQWYLNPAWQFNYEIEILQQYIANSNIKVPSVPPYVSNSEQFDAFDATHVQYPLSSYKSIGQFRLTKQPIPQTEEQKRQRRKETFIFHYLHPLSPDHPQIKLLNDLIQLLNDMQILSFFYLTPINHEAGTMYVGKAFLDIIQTNIKIITNLMSEQPLERLIFLDCSMMLRSKYFFPEDTPTEHLNQEGREILSQSIVNRFNNENEYVKLYQNNF